MCLEAVKKNGKSIKYINNPTEEMQLEAVKQDGYSIKYIKNPTKEMCMEAINDYGQSIQFIKNPTEEMCLEAVKQNSLAILNIENPTEEMCLEAVKKEGNIIEFIPKKNQTYDIIQEFFDFDWNKSKYIIRENYYKYLSNKFITKDQAIIMIEDNPENINLVSENIQKELVEIKPELKKYLSKNKIKDIDSSFFRKN